MKRSDSFSSLGQDIDREILKLCQEQGKIFAIKFCKENTAWDLQSCKDYVENLEAENNLRSGKTSIIERKGSGGCMLLVGSIFCTAWLALCIVIPLELDIAKNPSVTNSWLAVLLYISFGIIALPALILLIWFMRKEYTEKIEITSIEVNYSKKGWLRITQNWYEPLSNYSGVSAKIEDGLDNSAIYLVILQHAFNKKKDILLKENIQNQAEQLKIQEDYSKLLKLPTLRESDEKSKKNLLFVIAILIASLLPVFSFATP